MKSRFIIISLFIFIACEIFTKDDGTKPKDWRIVGEIFPDIGTNRTVFKPTINIFYGDSLQSHYGFQFRLDIKNDNVFDTEWLDTLPSIPAFTNYWKYPVKILVRDNEDHLDSLVQAVYVQELIQITQPHPKYFQGNPDYSRDGSDRIAFDMRTDNFGEGQVIWSVKFPGGDPVQISHYPDTNQYFYDQFPEWSPDGKKIACYSSNGVNIIDLDTGARTLVDSVGDNTVLAWSPDGNTLFYHKGMTYIYNFTNDTSRKYSDERLAVAWSPSGDRIAQFDYSTTDSVELKILNFPSGELVEKYIVPSRFDKMGWSPNGRFISLGFRSKKEHHTLDLETGNLISMVPGGLSSVWYPSWSENGSRLVFEGRSDAVRNPVIWAIRFPDDID